MAIDRASGLFSIFEAVEQITYSPIDKPLEGESVVVVSQQPMKVVSGWMMQPEKGDSFDQVFDYEHRAITPGGSAIELSRGTFSFGAGKAFHRFVVSLDGMVPVDRSGILYIEARIRKAGEMEWISQDYPIVVVVEGAPGGVVNPLVPTV